MILREDENLDVASAGAVRRADSGIAAGGSRGSCLRTPPAGCSSRPTTNFDFNKIQHRRFRKGNSPQALGGASTVRWRMSPRACIEHDRTILFLSR